MGICEKSTATIILSNERLNTFPVRSGIRQMFTLVTSIQRWTGGPSQGNQVRKYEMKDQKGRSKLFICRWDVTISIENPKGIHIDIHNY